MSVDPKSPFAIRIGDRLCEHVTVEDRMEVVRSCGVDRLHAIIAWQDSGLSVRKAAESRLRRLVREADRANKAAENWVNKRDRKTVSNAKATNVCEDDCGWKSIAVECLKALRLFNSHYDDMSKSNPGFLGRLCLQDYALLNNAHIAVSTALRKYANIANG